MNLLQTWLIVGVPGLIVAAGLFTGRSQVRAVVGYGVLLAVTGGFLAVPDPVSAAAVGMILVVLVATGRGQQADQQPEHHRTRRAYSVADRGE